MAWTSDIISGLERVYQLRTVHHFSSVNLSLGGGQFSAPCDGEPEKTIIDDLRSVGIATVVAAGNGGSINALSAPGCISSAVSVGSTVPSITTLRTYYLIACADDLGAVAESNENNNCRTEATRHGLAMMETSPPDL